MTGEQIHRGQSVVSPQMYRRYAKPMEQRYRRAVGREIVSLHICGKTDDIIEDMVETGCLVLQLDHFNDLRRTFERIGGRACVFGNLDTSSVLALGSPETVFEASRTAIAAARDLDARFVLCSGCTVGANTPIENLQAMTRAVIELGAFQDDEGQDGSS